MKGSIEYFPLEAEAMSLIAYKKARKRNQNKVIIQCPSLHFARRKTKNVETDEAKKFGLKERNIFRMVVDFFL